MSTTVRPHWVAHPRRSDEKAIELARALGAPLPVAHALVNRGVDQLASARRFLEPALEDLHDPREMLDLDRGSERILAAIANGERIFIQGDYDVDGITSTFLLQSVLVELGGRVESYIPNRTTDGYGLTAKSVEQAARAGCTLIVTVDCGITATEAVAEAKRRGIDTVITDHHAPPETLPDAVAVVNPLRPGCPYPFKELAGVGVTFKLAEWLLQARGGLDRARDYLDVVALGTIADVVPLVGENRILARYGLDHLNLGRRLGLRALARTVNPNGKRISSGQVAFVLAPRINAAGRMGNAVQGLHLLMARDTGEANALAASLEEDNRKRRELDERVLHDAVAMVETELGYPDCHSIVLWSDHWHLGVIGIVASRLVERFQRPTILVSLDRTSHIGRGSGRSLPGLDLMRLLEGCNQKGLLRAHGGHAFAAGLTIDGDPDTLLGFRNEFDALVRARHTPELFVRTHEVDAEVRVDECDDELVSWVERLAPHGLRNPEPLFLMRDAPVHDVTRVSKDRHLRFRVSDGRNEVEAIGFGMGAQATALLASRRADLLFVPVRNEFRDESRIQLKLKDLRIP